MKDSISSGFYFWIRFVGLEVKDQSRKRKRQHRSLYFKKNRCIILQIRSRLARMRHAPHTNDDSLITILRYVTHFIIRGFSLKLTRFATPTQFSLASQNSISFRFFLSQLPDVTTKSNETIKTEAHISISLGQHFACRYVLWILWVMCELCVRVLKMRATFPLWSFPLGGSRLIESSTRASQCRCIFIDVRMKIYLRFSNVTMPIDAFSVLSTITLCSLKIVARPSAFIVYSTKISIPYIFTQKKKNIYIHIYIFIVIYTYIYIH